MTTVPIAPPQANALGREYASSTPEQRCALYSEWLRRYGNDTAYELFLTGVAFITFPEDPAQFRAIYSSPSSRDADKREAVRRLSDSELEGVSAALRGEYLRAPSMMVQVWQLAKQMAGVA